MICEHCRDGNQIPPNTRTTEFKAKPGWGEDQTIYWCPECTRCLRPREVPNDN